MGCTDVCPKFPGVPNEEWNVPDPSGKSIEFMREIIDEMEERVRKLSENLKFGTQYVKDLIKKEQ